MPSVGFNPVAARLDLIELTPKEKDDIKTGASWQLPGPYTTEQNAAAAGVQVGQAYYDNGGTVRVRLT